MESTSRRSNYTTSAPAFLSFPKILFYSLALFEPTLIRWTSSPMYNSSRHCKESISFLRQITLLFLKQQVQQMHRQPKAALRHRRPQRSKVQPTEKTSTYSYRWSHQSPREERTCHKDKSSSCVLRVQFSRAPKCCSLMRQHRQSTRRPKLSRAQYETV